MKYHVYILIKDGKAVYIGCSGNMQKRINQHRRVKDFDKFTTLKTYKTKKEALIAENAIIRFLTLFGDGDWYNAENIILCFKREFLIREGNNG